MTIPLLLLSACLISPLCWGHDLWIEREGPVHTLAYGHERSGHGGAQRLEYRPDSVREALCIGADGAPLAAAFNRAYPATLRGDCAASWFLVSSGYWSKTPYGTRNLPKSEAGVAIDSWLSVEAVKRIDRWGEALARPLTKELELVPLDNPLALKPGDKLRLHAYLRGKPAAGVTVAYFGKPRGMTGNDGAINIRLNVPGFQRIQASLELPLNDGKADKAIHGAALQFQLK